MASDPYVEGGAAPGAGVWRDPIRERLGRAHGVAAPGALPCHGMIAGEGDAGRLSAPLRVTSMSEQAHGRQMWARGTQLASRMPIWIGRV